MPPLIERKTNLSIQLKYEDVEQYLRTFLQAAPAHEFGGLLHLVLAGIENLRENVTAEKIREYAHFMTDAQALFMQQLLADRAESMEWFKDDISHCNKTGQL